MSKKAHHTITVGELKELLEQFDDELPVLFSYDYGDHEHTTVAGTISSADAGKVCYSSYHRMNKVADGEDDEEDPNAVEAVIIQ